METSINTLTVKNTILSNLLNAVDGQANNKTAWYLFSLILQGVFFLPIPVVLLYYYHSSIIVLPITFGLYLGNIIVGMGGSGIRVVLGFLLLSVLINLSMLALYIL